MDISFVKAFITLINFIILIQIPINIIKCRNKIFKLEYDSFEWASMIVLTILWVVALSAEIPALIVRYLSYYKYHIQLPDILFVLNIWDRWLHLVFYLIFELYTYMQLNKKVPGIIKSTFG